MGASLIWATVENVLIHWTDLVQVKLMFWIHAEEQPEDLLALVLRGFTLTHMRKCCLRNTRWFSGILLHHFVYSHGVKQADSQTETADMGRKPSSRPAFSHPKQSHAHTQKRYSCKHHLFLSGEPFDPHYFPVVCVCMHIRVHWCSPVAVILKDNQSCATNWFWVQYTLCSVNS